MTAIVPIALSSASVLFLLITGLMLKDSSKNAYVALESHFTSTVSPSYNDAGLKALAYLTGFIALAQAAGNVYFLLPLLEGDWTEMVPFVITVVAWFLVLIFSGRINQLENAVIAGHFSLFLILLLLTAAQVLNTMPFVFGFPIVWEASQVIARGQLLVNVILVSIIGFWSLRHDADDEEFVSKENGASIFSRLSFHWMSAMIKDGNARPLEQKDLWQLIDDDRAEVVLAHYQAIRNPAHSLAWRTILFCYPYMLYQCACSFFSAFLQFAGPLFLFQIVSTLQIPNVNRITILPHLLGLFACSTIKAIIDGQIYFTGRRVGTRARTVLIEELYGKSLHRVQGTTSSGDDKDEQASLGKIVTLMSVDTERVREFLCYIHDPLIHLPIAVIVSISSLFFVLGWSALAGVAVIVILGPISTFLGKLIIRVQEEQLKNTDARVSIMNELLQGIRIIKYFSWENYFQSKINVAREKELASIVKLFGAYVSFGIVGHGSGIVIAFSTFYVYVIVAGNQLDAATAFTAINLLNVVRQTIMWLPSAVMQVFKAKVSIERISKYLEEQEISKYAATDKQVVEDDASDSEADTIDPMSISIGFQAADFRFYGGGEVVEGEAVEANSVAFNLRNLNVEFPEGKLSVICGQTAAGKTSLLLALLGEMDCTKGQYSLPKSDKITVNPATGFTSTVAYASQTAWLLNATIRDNILFGEEYDAKRYESVVRGCALAKDFLNLDGGDLTEIGEKGINVSGGQKQRISLARACYSRSAIVFLDDPLSAVDAPTARFLLHKAILGLLKGRTVLLVSHATNLVVPFADCVVAMRNGEIIIQGSPAEVCKNAEEDSLFGLDLTQDVYEEEEEDHSIPVATAAGEGTQLVAHEDKASGSVKFEVYKSYFVATGGILFFIMFWSGFVLTTTSGVANDWWLKVWTDHTSAMPAPNASFVSAFSTLSLEKVSQAVQGTFLPSVWSSWYIPAPPSVSEGFSILATSNDANGTVFYLTIYALFGCAVICAGIVQDVIVLLGALWASRKLHLALLHAVLYSPLRFFETTPIGRILNRFSRDIESIDSNVINVVQYFLHNCIRSITVIAVIGTVAPSFLIVVPVIGVVYLYVAQQYLNASRELKRLEAISRSPIYSSFSETLSGVCTIRAYEADSRFAAKNLQKIDDNHKPFFYMWAANRWLCLRTDILSSFVVLFAGLAVVFGGVDAGWAALTITYALDFTEALLWTVRMHAEMEMAMNSVERVQEYTMIEQEPPAIIHSHRPAPEWPQEGVIEIKNVSMRYAPELPDVLKNVSFSVKAHEKVAVVGRTGAGKSTLSLAFFRIIPFSSGSIVIDGEDIAELGLYDLRSRLTIIPQDPVLFQGTLRSNLDPLEANDDEKLWEALKRVNFLESLQQPTTINEGDSSLSTDVMQSEVSTNAVTLDLSVSENGANFSQGQRQLLCLARSLLQRNKIIFLDEATASVDNETDTKIQATIRREFADCSIITIAHRLRTIIDYDKVLVLDKGEVLEFGSPLDLIENSPVQAFKSMVEETGEYDELLKMAREAAQGRK